jgi:hypothetical protein
MPVVMIDPARVHRIIADALDGLYASESIPSLTFPVMMSMVGCEPTDYLAGNEQNPLVHVMARIMRISLTPMPRQVQRSGNTAVSSVTVEIEITQFVGGEDLGDHANDEAAGVLIQRLCHRTHEHAPSGHQVTFGDPEYENGNTTDSGVLAVARLRITGQVQRAGNSSGTFDLLVPTLPAAQPGAIVEPEEPVDPPDPSDPPPTTPDPVLPGNQRVFAPGFAPQDDSIPTAPPPAPIP